MRLPMSTGLLMLGLALGGCATPETRVRNGLLNAGFSRPVAGCMADRMVDRLSLLQLRRLGRLEQLDDEPLRAQSLERILHRARSLRDPEILAVVTTSAAICAVRSS